MSAEITIKMLECNRRPGALSPAEWKRIAARVAWARETVAALRKAQKEMDEFCDAAVDRLSDEEVEPRSSVRGTEREVQKVDAFRAPLKAAAEHDVWPQKL